MTENGTKAAGVSSNRVKDHIKHETDRLKHFRLHELLNKTRNKETHRTTEGTSDVVDCSNIQDFPYDQSRDDEFTSELASLADDFDGSASPRSQDSLRSTGSGQSWSSNQKTISGVGTKEFRANEVLGPYRHERIEETLESVPQDYEDFVNGRNIWPNGSTASAGIPSLARSSSTSSERGAPDSLSLYADLSSVSDRYLHLPDDLLKQDELDSGFDSEENATSIHTSQVKQPLSQTKI